MAVMALGLDALEPFDLDANPQHDILDNSMFHLLLRVAFSGIVGVGWSAQPCKRCSILKLRRPGPKPLRTPQHMNGVPGLSVEEQRQVDESREIHARARQLLRAVHEAVDRLAWSSPRLL